MRIAYLINQYPMATLTFVRREIHALEKLGFEVLRFALQPCPEGLVDDLDCEEASRTTYLKSGGIPSLLFAMLTTAIRHPIRFSRVWQISRKVAKRSDRSGRFHLAYLAEACKLNSQLHGTGVGHLHIHFATNSAEVGMLCRALGGPPYSFTVHGPEDFDRAVCQSLDEKARRAKFVAAISSFCRSQLYRWIDYEDWGKVKIVHCGLESDFLGSPATTLSLERRFVCVGRLCEQKGQLLLIEAVSVLMGRGLPIQLRLVGDGEMRPVCEAKIRVLGLQKAVTISGWATGYEVRQELKEASVLVLPSFAEGLPVVIMEAMALARPVISTYIAGIPELVCPGANGWLVPAGDVSALADAMQEAFECSNDQLQRMGNNAHQAVREHHDITIEAGKLARHILASDPTSIHE